MSEPSTVTRHLPVQMSHTKNRGACTCAISFWLHPSAAATHLTEHEKNLWSIRICLKKHASPFHHMLQPGPNIAGPFGPFLKNCLTFLLETNKKKRVLNLSNLPVRTRHKKPKRDLPETNFPTLPQFADHDICSVKWSGSCNNTARALSEPCRCCNNAIAVTWNSKPTTRFFFGGGSSRHDSNPTLD